MAACIGRLPIMLSLSSMLAATKFLDLVYT